MELAKQQAEAATLVKAWLAGGYDPKKPFFYLAGYAGTGKTTIAKVLTEEVKYPVFAAYTGKAASVLNKKGIPATTIHKLVYRLIKPDEFKAEKISKELALASPSDIERLRKELRDVYAPRFCINDESPLLSCDLLVVDEVSMVGEEIGRDLLSFRKPILVLGDPGQLPPISGEGFFTSNKPDFLLTDIHRQAAGNPIIGMATVVRQGGTLRAGRYGSSEVVWRNKFEPSRYLAYEQIICGRNVTRSAVNGNVRDALGYSSTQPSRGEKVICLRNNADLGILNGMQFWVKKSEDSGIYLDLNLTEDKSQVEAEIDEKVLPISCHPFGSDFNAMHPRERHRFQEFDFGYAVTCHKSQGSQWETVLIHNEAYCFREHSAKWIYTALTRAEKGVLVVL